MINILTLSSLALAMLHIGVALVSAHGYVSEPPSRQARCRLGEVPGCGDVRYEPQSVEGLQGSLLCNGNGARFAELNNDALWETHFLTVPPGVNSLPFTWTLTMPHRTTDWDYIMITQDNALLTSFNDFNSTPPATVTHEIPLGGFTGRQTVLARWSIGDTPNAFYSCVDLLISPPESATVVASAAATQLPVGIPLGMPGPGFAMQTNFSGSANVGPSVGMPLREVYIVPRGPS